MRQGFTLVSTIVTIAIIGLLAVALMYGTRGGESSREDGLGKTVPGAAMAKANDTVCKNNLSQVRQSLLIATNMGEDPYPETIEGTRLGESMYKCPIGSEKYEYNASTGKVKCPHPGHENY